jgi:hypothetical protein
MATATQVTVIRFTQKELQEAMRSSCQSHGINDNAIIEFHLTDKGLIGIGHSNPEASEPVNNHEGH